jgi:hypothetical protein
MTEGDRLYMSAAELGALVVHRGIGGGLTTNELHTAIMRGFGLLADQTLDDRTYDFMVKHLFKTLNSWLHEHHHYYTVNMIMPNGFPDSVRGVIVPDRSTVT